MLAGLRPPVILDEWQEVPELTIRDYLDLMLAGSFPEPSLRYRRPLGGPGSPGTSSR